MAHNPSSSSHDGNGKKQTRAKQIDMIMRAVQAERASRNQAPVSEPDMLLSQGLNFECRSHKRRIMAFIAFVPKRAEYPNILNVRQSMQRTLDDNKSLYSVYRGGCFCVMLNPGGRTIMTFSLLVLSYVGLNTPAVEQLVRVVFH